MKRIVVIAGLACITALPGSASAQTAQPAGQGGTGGAQGSTPSKPAGAGGQSGAAGQGGAAGSAGQGSAAGSATSSKAAPADRTFATHAAHANLAEVAMGKLAAQNAASPDVKQFGQRMVDDHGKASTELMSWASKSGVTLPKEIDAKHKAEQARLAKLTGAEFDRAYMTMMVAEHGKDVAEFQRASKTAQDPDLKAWAAKTLPTLQEHRKMAQDIHAKVKGSAGAKPESKSSGAPKQ